MKDETVAAVLLIFEALQCTHGERFAVHFVREYYPQICKALFELRGV